MIEERKIAFDNISRTLAITRYDIEQHQLVNDQSLNIHGENWFRDIFNFVYSNNFFVNENIETKTGNASAVDLIDKDKELAYQITTTRTKEKVEDTLKKIKTTEYKYYTLKIFFLLEKSKFKKDTKQYFKNEYNINIQDYLVDYTDLLKDIEALETDKIIELNKKLFIKSAEKYTDNIVLDLIFKHLLKEKKNVVIDYMDNDFGTVDTNSKLSLNEINEKISAEIKKSLDYRVLLDDFCNVDNLLTDLKSYIINDIYKNILLEKLKLKVSEKELLDKKTSELQDIATFHKIDFNILISRLHKEIENSIEIVDFNSMNIAWIIIAYFFELCDVGVDEIC
ncbi:SMEK domain-containing protein [Aliarcobacter cryaerophilus]|uniref:SMEK domain-containing protein n=1 Tax=Aliarcobacter cryaerophilus TaxID=28198 RepID=UPI0021B2A8C0|nr:SMEK domain-containing protein [Aliarcobacter cryaerophilus]MCT7445264.1 SMEK domain-containing protein [Aliarcobacter cryaerophilus]MCT7480176.1 SMEK domain-containing protein [Aliarcobacter cryaerophilus]MCT7489305.1 SMEK domain-containing protein [Aliarcobacter cryaerophilus]